MLIHEKEKLSNLLSKTAAALDIPDHVYEDATLKYEEVGGWLAEEDSELKSYLPEIYPQGSFRLGTVVRPLTNQEEFDIDLVCHLQVRKEQTTQKDLKEMVGKRLRKHEDLKAIVSSSRRCWTLDYPQKAHMPRFHMDVLPAIPNAERPPTGILLTDTELAHWQKSNPKAYAEWFYGRMRVILMEKRAAIAKATQASIEEVPEWQVKTPLQVAIQILKRHRDIHFQPEEANKPVSVIITTLAGHSYRNQSDIYDALTDIARDMPRYIENRNGRWWVANPVDSDENFADKWNESPDRREAFMRWSRKVGSDFSELSQKRTLNEAVESLGPSLGRSVVAKVAGDLGIKPLPATSVAVGAALQVASMGDSRHCQGPPWPVRQAYRAEVTWSVHVKKGWRRVPDLFSRSVPKNISLKFKVDTDTPYPFDVKWQVVNTGKEATEAHDLRGDFYDGEASNNTVRWEHTKYNGTHWVEAFIIKNGVCVARSGKKIVRIR